MSYNVRMRIILELKTDCISKEDIVYYDGKHWINKSKSMFLKEQQDQIDTLKKENEELQKSFESLKTSVNDKLKQYHDILQLSVEDD